MGPERHSRRVRRLGTSVARIPDICTSVGSAGAHDYNISARCRLDLHLESEPLRLRGLGGDPEILKEVRGEIVLDLLGPYDNRRLPVVAEGIRGPVNGPDPYGIVGYHALVVDQRESLPPVDRQRVYLRGQVYRLHSRPVRIAVGGRCIEYESRIRSCCGPFGHLCDRRIARLMGEGRSQVHLFDIEPFFRTRDELQHILVGVVRGEHRSDRGAV